MNCQISQAQKMLDKGRLKQNGEVVRKNQIISGEVEFCVFEPKSLGLDPIFQTQTFAVYDKPPKLLVHPKGLFEHNSLCDEIKQKYGQEAQIAHRIDYQTSGLVLVGLNRKTQIELKKLFQDGKIKKTYQAIVEGKISQNMTIDLPIAQQKEGFLKIRSIVSLEGKPSKTLIYPKTYCQNKNQTLLEIEPLTGRTHQIRVHLHHIGHKIVGESLYGVDDRVADDYLSGKEVDCQKEFGSQRLLLHAQKLEFSFEAVEYSIKSDLSLEGYLEDLK